MRVAAEVGPLELAEYQRAVRLLLRNPLITSGYPDRNSLPMIRRWADQLRTDLFEVLGYRLIMTAGTARLLRAQDELDASRPARTRTDRPFDRRRYAYLVLALAALGRSGTQVALSELADAVAADASRIDGLGLDTERKAERDAFVDAVAWLEKRGALALADGSAIDWVTNPDRAEALYDIDREIVFAIHRPSRVLQHLGSVTALLDIESGLSQGRETARRAQARRARRLVLERPAVYYADVSESLRGQLRGPALAEDLERLTGLAVERRAEGVAIIDTSGKLSDTRFPAGGAPAQAALLLAARIAGHITSAHPAELPAPTAAERLAELATRIDAALPARGVLGELALSGTGADRDEDREDDRDEDRRDTRDEDRDLDRWNDREVIRESGPETPVSACYPFVTDAFLRGAMKDLMGLYGMAFGVSWRGEPDRLLREALSLLDSIRLIARVEGGVLALPLLARYRGATAEVKPRRQATLFELETVE